VNTGCPETKEYKSLILQALVFPETTLPPLSRFVIYCEFIDRLPVGTLKVDMEAFSGTYRVFAIWEFKIYVPLVGVLL
jgi:hypothetical protein